MESDPPEPQKPRVWPYIAHCELLDYECDQKWEEMGETREVNVRFCRKCVHNVYLCETEEEFLHHAERGHCVAFDAGNPDSDLRRLGGMPRRIERRQPGTPPS